MCWNLDFKDIISLEEKKEAMIKCSIAFQKEKVYRY